MNPNILTDSSRDRGSTFDFQIGVGQVIKGWDEGIVGLCVGAKAKLIIPPEKGYGAQGEIFVLFRYNLNATLLSLKSSR
jgi:FKBP-type peptidyl-prolyl cis-trans isomerase